jgi:hypothetical protein
MRLVWSYVERHGRPVSYYTDKAGIKGGAKIDHETPGKRRFVAVQK